MEITNLNAKNSQFLKYNVVSGKIEDKGNRKSYLCTVVYWYL
jgi:hypothetical protein